MTSYTAHPPRSATFERVSFRRLMAWVVDSLLIAALTSVVVTLTLFTGLFVLPIIYAAVAFVYRSLTIAASSATPGMLLMGIELRASNGAPLDLPLAVGHTLAYMVSVAMAPLQFISVVLMGFSATGRGLGDRFLDTHMTRKG